MRGGRVRQEEGGNLLGLFDVAGGFCLERLGRLLLNLHFDMLRVFRLHIMIDGRFSGGAGETSDGEGSEKENQD